MEIESIKGKKLNKGEWAEFYVLLKLLGEGRLYTADKLLRKNLNNYLDIIRVIRQELETIPIDYIVDDGKQTIRIEAQKEVLSEIPMSDFIANGHTPPGAN